jgi:hypothetical protein
MFRRLSLLWRRFTPIEEAVFAEVEKALPAGCKEKFVRQRQAINRVQRILDWTEINFYSVRRGAVNWEPSIAFRNRGELELAEIRFSIQRRDFRSTLGAVTGHVFSLVTRPSIKPYAFQKITAISEVTLLNDPEDASGNPAMRFSLPSSYLAWMGVCERREVNGWAVCDEGQAYVVHLSDGDYAVLAVREGVEYLMARIEGDDPDIYYSANYHDLLCCKGSDFAEVLREL